ncbi:FtsX-like permease family protein [Kribbella deserti]|uniref:FtsX-like permease family protein n=1 Tax=Kribbella deserti TaxID=1926257 RepID=A0ABV6QLW6_9ACTN
MFHLSRQTVRHGRSLYAGSFVALAVGVLMLGLAATTTAATLAYQAPPGETIRVHVTGGDMPARWIRVSTGTADVSGLQTVLGIVGMLSGFITIFVVASTFAFAVASRRRELGLLRLIGATPRQTRWMILGEAFVVALAASLTGAVAAALGTPALLAKASYTELAPVRLHPAGPWLPLAIAVGAGLIVAMLGARSAARRAGRVAAIDALREADLEPPRAGVFRIVVGLMFLAGAVTMLVLIRPGTGEAVIPLAMFSPMVLVVAFMAFAPLVVPWIGRVWAVPLVALTRISGRLARANVLAAPRRSASLAAPILAISAIAGSMVLTLGFAADASSVVIRDTLRAPIVVTGNADRIAGTPGVAAVDGSRNLPIVRTDRGDAYLEEATGIDPAAAVQARQLAPIAGSLANLKGNTVAIAKDLSSFDNYKLGSTMKVAFADGKTASLRVVAILPNAPELNAEMLIPMTLAAAHGAEPPAEWFVVPEAGTPYDVLLGALRARGVEAVAATEWEQRQSDAIREGNQFGLVLLLGPAALYSAIAIVNTLLMASLQRKQEFASARLLGTTAAQLRRMVLWESSLVGAVALSLGTAITVTVGLLLRRAMTHGLTAVPLTIDWPLLLTIATTCLVLTTTAALAPTLPLLRPTRRPS